MILIFGGTTEGRTAVKVCEQAGQPYYYSTKGCTQKVELHHGVRLCGPMTAADILKFCEEKGIRCIIDAGHPFAEQLHQAIADTQLPVIRLQRLFPTHREGVTYCSNFQDAIQKMEKTRVQRLLALTGSNTIQKLKPYWQEHETVFRILNRPESLAMAEKLLFPTNKLVFYSEAHTLPTLEQEQELMQQVNCDAIITKESGESGGLETKIEAALKLGKKVFVVEQPRLSDTWTYVTGEIGLRRAIEQQVPEFFPLKTGLTTGTCATAAVKGALQSLLGDERVEHVNITLPDGEEIPIPVTLEKRGCASVIKEQNDDPDVTRGCKITASVELTDESDIIFQRGKGVGLVTLPGLGIPVGGPAINPTPRKMIEKEIRRLTSRGAIVTLSVENGEELAKQTFNPRVGVVDGISIIGTTGIVFPLSHEAFVQSINREMDVAYAMGCKTIGITSGKRGEDALHRQYPELRVIHYGNLIGETLAAAHRVGMERVVLGIMIGKAVKLAEGHLNTHSHKVTMNLDFLREIAGPEAYKIDGITLARELWTRMSPAFFEKIKSRCYEHCKTVFPTGNLTIHLICDEQA